MPDPVTPSGVRDRCAEAREWLTRNWAEDYDPLPEPETAEPKSWTLVGKSLKGYAGLHNQVVFGPNLSPGQRVEVVEKGSELDRAIRALREAPMEFRGEGRDRVGIVRSADDWADYLERLRDGEPGD